MNKVLKKDLLILSLITILFSTKLAAQTCINESCSNYSGYYKKVPKYKHKKIKKIIKPKFVDVPNEIPGLSKEESQELIHKIKNTIHKERHRKIKHIIEQEDLTYHDIKTLIKEIRKEKEELAPKIEAAVQHINRLLKQKLKEGIKEILGKDQFKEKLNQIRLDFEKELDKERKEHDAIIEQLKVLL